MDRGLGALGLPAFDEEALLRQFARDEDGDVNQPQAPQIDERTAAQLARPAFIRPDERHDDHSNLSIPKPLSNMRDFDLSRRREAFSVLSNKLPPKVRVLVNETTVPLYDMSHVEEIASSDILNFTDIYGPDPPMRFPLQPLGKKQKRRPTKTELDHDDEEEFELMEIVIPPPDRKSAVPQDTSKSSNDAMDLEASSSAGARTLPAIDPLLALKTLNWEKDIIFDTDAPPQSEGKPDVPDAMEVEKVLQELVYQPPKVEDPFALPVESNFTFSGLLSLGIKVSVPTGSVQQQNAGTQSSGASIQLVPKSVLPQRNRWLDSGDWAEAIQFDTDRALPPSARKMLNELVLDLNDSHLIFEEEKEDAEEEAPEEAPAPQPDEEEEAQVRLKAGKGGRNKKRRTLKLPNRMLTARDLALKQAREALLRSPEIDPFNLSNDVHYIVRSSHHVADELTHSVVGRRVASTRGNPTPLDLVYFHRPRMVLSEALRLPVVPARVRRDREDRPQVLLHYRDLSARDGRVLAMEYVEEHPPILTNPGMASKIRNYYRKTSEIDVPQLSFEDGESVLLNPSDPSPYIADFPPGSSVQSLENNLYKAPLFRHNPQPTDFLLCRKLKEGDDTEEEFTLREMPPILVVGQEFPIKDVWAPGRSDVLAFKQRRLENTLARLFRERKDSGKPPTLTMSEIYSALGTKSSGENSEQSLRKRILRFADPVRAGNDASTWRLREDVRLKEIDELRDEIPPEDVVLYECMLAGVTRLSQVGLVRYSIPPSNITQLVGSVSDEHRLKTALKVLEEELLLTPWNLTGNFVKAAAGQIALQLTGLGDPSGRGEGFSFLKQAQKTMHPRKEERNLAPKSIIGGTDADLRKLTMEQLNAVLAKFGLKPEEWAPLRWDKVKQIRALSSQAKMEGANDNVTRFARNLRLNMAVSQQEMNRKLHMIWEQQSKSLSRPDPPSEEESDGEEDLLAGVATHKHATLPTRGIERVLRQGPRLDEQEEVQNFLRAQKTMAREGETGVTAPVESPAIASAVLMFDTDKKEVINGLYRWKLKPEPKQSIYLLRSRMIRAGSGKARQQTLITDPADIAHVTKQQKKSTSKGTGKSFRILQAQDKEAEEEKKREKKRRAEAQRREQKALDLRKKLQERYIAGETDGFVPGHSKSMQCERCNMFGHSQTHKACPLYIEEEGVVLDEVEAPEEKRRSRNPKPFQSRNRSRKPADKYVVDDNEELSLEEELPDDWEESYPSEPEPDEEEEERKEKTRRSKAETAPPAPAATPVIRTQGTTLKISFPAPQQDQANSAAKQQKKRKRVSEDEDDEGFSSEEDEAEPGFRGPSPSKRPRNSNAKLKQIWTSIVREVSHLPEAIDFLAPVTDAIAPGYRRVIKEPIAIADITRNINTGKYSSADDFLSDWELMKSNCIKYNTTRFVGLIPCVEYLVQLVRQRLDERRDEINALD